MTAAEIAQALGGAKAEGNEWRCACPVCNRHNLTLRDGKKRLLTHCFNGCTSKDVLAELRRRELYGKPGGNGAQKSETSTEHEARARAEAADHQFRIDNAMELWKNGLPAPGTIVEVYLWSRLLMDPVPASLRYVPAHWHKEEGRNYPAMIGLVEHVIKGATAVHLTYLNPLDPASRLTVEPRKRSLGPIKGGAVRLAPAGREIAVAEGIEDALAFMGATGTPSWAAISETGIGNFVPPPLETTQTIVLIEDNDPNGAGQKAVADSAGRLAKAGYAIRIARPVVGKDLNEALLERGPAETFFTIEDYAPSGPTGDWYSKCLAGSDGRTLCNLANTLLALREDAAVRGLYTYNGMFDSAMLARHPLWGTDIVKSEYPSTITDEDITAQQEWLQLAGLPTVSRDTVYQAVELVARKNTFHPIKDYLEPLVWDGTQRLDDWLTDCFGVDKTEYAMAVGRMFLIGMVARIYEPGCQADYMLILEGMQGIKKSTACRVIAGEWFSDSMPENVASKDAQLHLRGKWLVEIGELHQFNRAETTALKAFITRREDIYRPPYGRKEVYRPRQNLFVGTTNKTVYLQDPTGARRFWPVVTTEIDLDLLISLRDRLFAEALVRYRRGEHWWPDPEFESMHMVPEQETRFESDAWEQPIAEYLARKPNPNLEHPNGRTTVFEIARKALNFETQRVGTSDSRRITAILEHLGWRRGKRTGAEGTRWWVRPPALLTH